MNKCVWRFVGVSFCIGLLMMVVVPAYAQIADDNNSGIDLFVLIDQSNSMSGVTNPPSDPNQLRVDTAQYLVDYLGFDALTQSNKTNRICVIGFGSPENTHVMVPLTSVSGQTPQQSDQILKNTKQMIVAEQLGNTSVVSALELVADQLSSTENLGNDRHVVIVLITDGAPYDTRLLSRNEYFDEIETRYSNIQAAYNTQWTLFVVGIDEQDSYWSLVEPRWQRLAKEAKRVEQSEAMKTEIVGMLSPELGYEGNTFGPGEVFVEPYLEWVSFSVFKYTDNMTVTISYPDSPGNLVELNIDNPHVIANQVGERYELWVIQNPTPGQWRIETQDTGKVDIFKQIQYSTIQMTFPTKAHPQYFPLYLRFSIPYGQDLTTQYPLDFELALTAPDGTVEDATLLSCCKLTDDGIFTLSEPYFPDQAGDYKLHVRAQTTVNVDGSRQTLTIFDDEFTFSTYAPAVSIAQPLSPYLQYLPIPEITFHFTDQLGEIIVEDPDTSPNLILHVAVPTGQNTTMALQKVTDGVYRTGSPVALPGDGPKGLEVIAQDEEGLQLFQYMLQINTFRNLSLVEPVAAVPLNSKLSSVSIALLDQEGHKADLSGSFPLTLDMTIFPPQGNPVAGKLIYNLDTKTFDISLPLPTSVQGEYTIHIMGKSEIDGKEIVTFEDDLTYIVTTDIPYYQVLSPTLDHGTYPLHDGLSRANMPIQLQWVQSNAPVDPARVFVGDPADLISVDIVGPDGFALTELKLQPDNNDRSLWGIAVPGLEKEGVYTTTFHFQGAELISQVPYMSFDNLSIPFAREETTLWRALKFAFGTVLVILAALAIAWAGNEAYERLVPPFPKGVVSIMEYEPGQSAGTQIEQINLFKHRRRTVIWKPKGGKATAMKLHRIVIRRHAGRRTGQQEGIKLEAFDKQGIRWFGMVFDRGEAEKRVPGTVSDHDVMARATYRIKYEPPYETAR